jgi:hypothetical protein
VPRVCRRTLFLLINVWYRIQGLGKIQGNNKMQKHCLYLFHAHLGSRRLAISSFLLYLRGFCSEYYLQGDLSLIKTSRFKKNHSRPWALSLGGKCQTHTIVS